MFRSSQLAGFFNKPAAAGPLQPAQPAQPAAAPAVRVETTAQFFGESRQALLADGVDPKCVICGNQRDEKDCKILSHLIPRSVLNESKDIYCANVNVGRIESYKVHGFKGFCAACENSLSKYGEGSLNPVLHRPLVLSIGAEVIVNDPKVFHALLSVGWRGLALSEAAGSDNALGKLVRSWLDSARSFVRTGDAKQAPPCTVLLDVLHPDDTEVCTLSFLSGLFFMSIVCRRSLRR